VNKKKILFFVSFSILILTFSIVWYKTSTRPVSVDEVFSEKVWNRPVSSLPEIPKVGLPRAENCGRCHTEIYKEWKLSTHAHALSDLQFQSELGKPGQPKWICLNCHIPIQNQRETVIDFLNHGDYLQPIESPNPTFDPVMKEEAITCATCHVKLDKTGNSYVLGANGTTTPPHPIKIDQKALRNRCLDCHNETYNLSTSLVCYFQTGKEMKEAEVHHPNSDCVTCHMPEVKRSFVSSAWNKPPRVSHKHNFVGGGVPKEFSLYAYQLSGGYRPGVKILNWKKKNSDTISVTYQNANAGHYVPSGDPERFLKIELSFFDHDGKLIATKEDRIGQIWQWDPQAKLVSENRLRPMEIRTLTSNIPSQMADKVVFRIYHVKLKDQTSDYMSQNVDQVAELYRSKVTNIKDLYPHSSLVLESSFDLKTEKSSETSLVDLFKRNEKRRGE